MQEQEIISLIESLYSAKDTHEISHIQNTLQELQKSDQGLSLANYLLSNKEFSANVKFFGSLTYLVKLTQIFNHGAQDDLVASIASEMAHHLLNNLDNKVVATKLLSNLTFIYIHYNSEGHEFWKNPLNSLILLFNGSWSLNSEVPYENLISVISSDERIMSLLLAFSQTIAEDSLKLQAKNNFLHTLIHDNVYITVYSILQWNFQHNKQLDVSLTTALAWFNYVSFAQNNSIARFDLNPMYEQILTLLAASQQTEQIVQFFSEVFESNPLTMNYDLRSRFQQMIFGEGWGVRYLEACVSNDQSEALTEFSLMLTRFLDIDMVKLVSNLVSLDDVYQFLMNLTNFPGNPLDDEEVSKTMIPFWSSYADIVIDDFDRIKLLLDEQQLNLFSEKSTNLFQQLVQIYYNKIKLFSETPDEAFKSYRRDVLEFFDLCHNILGNWMIDTFINIIASNPSDLVQVECSLMCLSPMFGNFYEDAITEETFMKINSLFETGFLAHMSGKPLVWCMEPIQFLSVVKFFFKNKIGHPHLGSVMEFLFASMTTSSIRTIAEICNDSRDACVIFLPQFMNLLPNVLKERSIDSFIREKFFLALGCLIQASPQEQQVSGVSQVISMIRESIDPHDIAYTQSLIACVQELSAGMKCPDERTASQIDWSGTRDQIMHLIQQFPNSMENICTIFKNGLHEENSPFKFPVSTILAFLSQARNDSNISPVTQLLIDIVKFAELSPQEIDAVLKTFFIDNPEISKDPELISCFIELVMEIKPMVFFNSSHFTAILTMFLQVIELKEKYVIKNICSFWGKMISNRKYTRQESEFAKSMMNELGTPLVLHLMNATIECQRSDLPSFCEVIRTLVGKYQGKQWFIDALQNNSKVSDRQVNYTQFVNKLYASRGGRPAIDVVKDFWQECNGLVDYSKQKQTSSY